MMKKRNLFAALILPALIAGAFATDGIADGKDRKSDQNKRMNRSPNSFALSGVYSGSLKGTINLGGQEIVITRNTRVYKTGKGMVDHGRYLSNTPIYVTGKMKSDRGYARLVIVSDRQSSSGGDGSEGISEVGPDDAQ